MEQVSTGDKKMSDYHKIEKILFRDDIMFLKVDGKEYAFPISDISKRPLKASKQERETFEISPSGYGIHWPLPDEDLSIDGLLGVRHQSAFKHSIVAVPGS